MSEYLFSSFLLVLTLVKVSKLNFIAFHTASVTKQTSQTAVGRNNGVRNELGEITPQGKSNQGSTI